MPVEPPTNDLLLDALTGRASPEEAARLRAAAAADATVKERLQFVETLRRDLAAPGALACVSPSAEADIRFRAELRAMAAARRAESRPVSARPPRASALRWGSLALAASAAFVALFFAAQTVRERLAGRAGQAERAEPTTPPVVSRAPEPPAVAPAPRSLAENLMTGTATGAAAPAAAPHRWDLDGDGAVTVADAMRLMMGAVQAAGDQEAGWRGDSGVVESQRMLTALVRGQVG
ncbi:MAG: hypothetical protein HY719_08120 [Planctomycetes bacterium]|nr:hypothetical protein [Planctomycetota bacterium]